MSEQKLDVFSKYLSVWVAAAMVLGALLGNVLPGLADTLGNWQIANVSIPVLLFSPHDVPDNCSD